MGMAKTNAETVDEPKTLCLALDIAKIAMKVLSIGRTVPGLKITIKRNRGPFVAPCSCYIN